MLDSMDVAEVLAGAEPPMAAYGNRSGNSGVAAFAVLGDGLVVEFVGGDRYVYSERLCGRAPVAEMQRLARAGRGLSTYISRNRPPYEPLDRA